MINYIRKHTAEFWCASFLDELRGRAQQRLQTAALALEKHTVFAAYRASAERLFLLDYDVRRRLCPVPRAMHVPHPCHFPFVDLAPRARSLCAQIELQSIRAR